MDESVGNSHRLPIFKRLEPFNHNMARLQTRKGGGALFFRQSVNPQKSVATVQGRIHPCLGESDVAVESSGRVCA